MFIWLALLKNYSTNAALLALWKLMTINDQLGTPFGLIGYEVEDSECNWECLLKNSSFVPNSQNRVGWKTSRQPERIICRAS
jgi:hypothetical protein